MESFGERLSKLMRSVGLTEKNLALLLNVSEQRVENLLTGYSEADLDVLVRVAEVFNVSYDYAAARSDDPEVHESSNSKEIFVAERISPYDGVIMQKDVVGTAFVDKSKMHGKEYFGFIMPDDSMVKARILKNDTLIVRRQNFANNGDVVIAVVDDGDAIVRTYNRTGNVVILTCEGDGMKYRPIKIDTTETKFSILGKVDEVRISF